MESADEVFAARMIDGDLAPDTKTEQLEQARQQVHALVAAVRHTPQESANDPVLVALADAGTRFSIPLEAFGELIDGLRRKGRPVPVNDIWIAATCARAGATLLTWDAHFRLIPRIGTIVLDSDR